MHNTGINADDVLRAAQARVAAEVEWQGPALLKADEDKIVYEITFGLPNVGLPLANGDLQQPLGDNRDNTGTAAVTHDDKEVRCYLLRARRSVITNQPYNAYAPQTTF